MFELTKAAKEQLDMHFTGKDVSPIRVYMAAGCGGPRLALALDEQKDNDAVHKIDGYTFLVETDLMNEVQPVSVEFDPHMGFNIKSSLKVSASGCSSCSSCG